MKKNKSKIENIENETFFTYSKNNEFPKNVLKALTPNMNVDISGYKEALDFVFDDDSIRNIAMSGSYGSGKSSILASYKKKRPERKFLHVSVAHFEHTEEDKVPKDEQSSILEWKILNQLVHQIEPNKLTLSRFKAKKKYSLFNKNLIFTTILFGILIFIGTYIYQYNNIISFKNTLNNGALGGFIAFLSDQNTFLIGIIVFCMLFLICIYYILHLQRNNLLFKKIKVKDNEIEMFQSEHDSYFDHYLNEVVYIFSNIEEKIIVFEDIDRFSNSGIFERLHEINRLINLNQSKDKIIRFFYLIRDDVFVSKDRTKFFDFIIPIIPVTDSSNAQDILLMFFKNSNIENEIDSRFLKDISLYLDDMRVIKNIFNEYIIYKTRLGVDIIDSNLNHTRLLSIIIYKNLFPKDFSDLQLNEGLVHSLFEQKNELVKSEIIKLNGQIEKLEKRIELIKNEVAKSSQELKALFLKLYPANNYTNNTEIKSDKIEEYEERNALIVRNIDIENINVEINIIKEKISVLKLYPLRKVLTKNNIDAYFSDIQKTNAGGETKFYNDVKTNKYFDLLKYLIRNGFIDASYQDYMSYFYEESISRVDKIFLRSIADQKNLEPAYQLMEPKKIVDNIDQLVIQQPEVLNYDLLDYMLVNDFVQKINNLLPFLFQQIKKTYNYDFIYHFFINKRKSQKKLVKYLTEAWGDFWNDVYINKKFDSDFVKEFSILILINGPFLNELEFNINNNLAKYISTNVDYLKIDHLSSKDETMLIDTMKKIEVSFTSIENFNSSLLRKIYLENLYELTKGNITLMLNSFYDKNLEIDVEKNYSNIMSDESSPLANYIKTKKEDYLTNLIKDTSNRFVDSLRWFLDILNDENLSKGIREKYLNRSYTKIPDILSVNNKDFWNTLLINNQIVYNENNLYEYYLQNKKDFNTVAKFINTNDFKLNMSKLKDKESYSFFFRFIVENPFIDDEKYRQILTSFKRYYNKFKIEGITKEKIDILINSSIIKMTEDNLIVIRKHYSYCLNNFILKNLSVYLELLNEKTNLIVQEELVQLLKQNPSIKEADAILNISKENISIKNNDFNEEVILSILERKVDKDDLIFLFNEYEKYGPNLRNKICVLAVRNLNILEENLEAVPKKIIYAVLNDSSFSLDKKDGFDFFVKSLLYLDSQEISQLFKTFNLTEFVDLFNFEKRKRIVIKATSFNLSILEALKNANQIIDFNLVYSDERYIIKRNKN